MASLVFPIDTGQGEPVVMLPGFALSPAVYRATAELCAQRGACRVVVPELYRVGGSWNCDDIAERLRAAVDESGFERVTMIAHSFAGSVQLEFATRWPERVGELVFADTLAVSREWPLAREAMRHPFRLVRMATPSAAAAFATTIATHPRNIAEAAWWGFTSARDNSTREIAADGIPAHVLWANRDSILSQSDGRAFAAEMNATFDVAREPNGRPVDHDWMYRHPGLFVDHLEALDLMAFRSASRSGR